MSRSAFLAALTAGVLAIAGCEPADEETSSAPNYNVVVISVDALRADHLGSYGYDAPTTPFLDTLSAESVVFERAYAPSSFTLQSVAAVLTGRAPTSGGAVSQEAQPHENAESLARLFRSAGLRTGIFSNQFLLSPRGFTRGFEGIQIATLAIDQPAQTAFEVSENALQFVDDYAPESFFLFAHYAEPHQPYAPAPETASRFGVDDSDISVVGLTEEIAAGQPPGRDDARINQLKARYDAEIATVDQAIQALVDGLSERGLAENTIVIVTGSQGQEFMEHDYLGHAWTLFEEVLRVPMIVHAPGLIEPQRVTDPVSTIDIYPTLVELFDLDLDTDAWQPDGSSFLSDSFVVRVREDPRFAELVIREKCILRAVVLNEWKYIAEYISCPPEQRYEIGAGYRERLNAIASGEIEAPSYWGEIENEMLFNLADDPGETRNLLDEDPEQLAYMRGLLEDYQRYCELYALRAIEAVPMQELDPELAERLRGMGYN